MVAWATTHQSTVGTGYGVNDVRTFHSARSTFKVDFQRSMFSTFSDDLLGKRDVLTDHHNIGGTNASALGWRSEPCPAEFADEFCQLNRPDRPAGNLSYAVLCRGRGHVHSH